MMRLSILIPVYNERQTIEAVVASVSTALPGVDKEIIIVDDGSSDGTSEFLRGIQAISVKTLFHQKNRGKGAALRTALAAATGEIIVIQDADLEYDPADWAPMYDLIAVREVADVVYGSRFYGRPHRSLYFHHYLANRLISFLFNVIYNQTLTDVEVCYKMFKSTVFKDMSLVSDDFGIEIELSAKIAKMRKLRIYEIGISYFGRSYDEGKKINWSDGVKALWYLLKFRF